jgi:MFS family permease
MLLAKCLKNEYSKQQNYLLAFIFIVSFVSKEVETWLKKKKLKKALPRLPVWKSLRNSRRAILSRLPEKREGKQGLKEIFGTVNKSLTLKVSYICSLITRADMIIIATFLLSWAVKAGDSYGLTSEATTQKASLPMIGMGVVSFIAFPVVGVLLDKWGRVPTIILALICGGAGLILLSIAPNPFSGLVYGAVMLVAVGVAGSMAGANTLATDAAPPGMVGPVLGGLNTMQPIGILFFVGIGGYLFDAFCPGWAFAIKGIANLILCVWVFMIKGRISTIAQQK